MRLALLARLSGLFAVAPLAAAQTTIQVSTAPGASFSQCEDPSMSGDGELVSFSTLGSSAGHVEGTYIWRRSTGSVELIGAGDSGPSHVARGGEYVVWTTSEYSLCDGDIFLYSATTNSSTQVDLDPHGQPLSGRCGSPVVSANGRFVAFVTNDAVAAPGHPGVQRHIVVRDTWTGVNELITVRPDGSAANGMSDFPSISDDGNVIAFLSLADILPGDTPGTWNIFVRDRASGTTQRVGTDWTHGVPEVSGDGRFVVVDSHVQEVPEDLNASDDVYVFDRESETYELISKNPLTGLAVTGETVGISRHGRYVSFGTNSSLLPEDADIHGDLYVYDRLLGTLELASPDYDGGSDAGGSTVGNHAISDDGRFVAFAHSGQRLVPGDEDGFQLDIFQRDRAAQTIGVPFCDPAVPNSSGLPAVATASGSTQLSESLFGLSATQLPLNQPGYFLLSMTTGVTSNPAGAQGNLCLLGTIGRLREQVQSSGSTGVNMVVVDLQNLPTPLQPAVLAGETWAFQCWFRDWNPGPTSNFTNAIVVAFQ